MHTTYSLENGADNLQPTDSKLVYCGILQGDTLNNINIKI